MSLEVPRSLGVADYVVVAVMLSISTFIGFYHAHRAKKNDQGTEGYLLGGRSVNFFPVAISLAVNFKSSVTVLGIPADVYHFGSIYVWVIVGGLLAGPIVSYLFLPVLYNLKISSAYEYIEKRYGRVMRMTITTSYMLHTLLYMGVNIYGPSLALSRVTGFPQIVAMLTTGIVCVTYTTLGGLKGVIWSDVFQASVMTLALISFATRGVVVLGGFGELWKLVEEGGRDNFVRWDTDPRIRYSSWTGMIGACTLWTASLSTSQANVQRYFSVKSLKKARWALYIGISGIAVTTILTNWCGWVLYGLYRTCDPTKAGCIELRDELMPFAVMDLFRSFPGMRGFFLAGVFSASLSTVSSGLNAMTAVIVTDYLKPYTKWTDVRYERISRVLTLCLGFTIIGCGFIISMLGDILSITVSLIGSFGGPFLGVFLLGIWVPFVNSLGAMVGFLSGLMGTMVIFIGKRSFKKPDYLVGKLPVSTSLCPLECGYMDSANATLWENHMNISYSTSASEYSSYSTVAESDELDFFQSYCSLSFFYMSCIGLLYTVVVGIIVSLLSGGWKQRHSVDRNTISPLLEARIFKCLPYKIRSFFGCIDGIDSTEINYWEDEVKMPDESEALQSDNL